MAIAWSPYKDLQEQAPLDHLLLKEDEPRSPQHQDDEMESQDKAPKFC